MQLLIPHWQQRHYGGEETDAWQQSQQCTFRVLLLLCLPAFSHQTPLVNMRTGAMRLSKYAHRGMRISHMILLTLIAILTPAARGCMPYLKKARPARTPPAISNSDMTTQTTPHPCGGKHLHTGCTQARLPRLKRSSGRKQPGAAHVLGRTPTAQQTCWRRSRSPSAGRGPRICQSTRTCRT